MPEQTSLPPEGEREYPDTCAWCGDGGALPYEIEPARYGRASNGTEHVLKKHAVVAPACATHRERFDAEKAAREAEKEATRVKKRGPKVTKKGARGRA